MTVVNNRHQEAKRVDFELEPVRYDYSEILPGMVNMERNDVDYFDDRR